MFSKFFINRPIFATVTALLILVAGLITLISLPVAQYPDITPPTVQVSATYPGADATTVAQTVGMPIEQQVNGVDGMLYMSSTSSSSGSYSLTVTFEVGTDIDMATVQVQNRVDIAKSSLPNPVIVQGVTVQKRSTDIVLFLSLISSSPEYDALYLSNYGTLNLLNELTRLPGVGDVDVMGAGDYSMRVWMDPELMRIRGVSPEDVYSAISDQNVNVSPGSVGQAIGDNKNAFEFTLIVKGRLTTPEEFGNIIVRNEGNGEFLRIKDIATVIQESSNYDVVATLSGKPSAAIAIYQQPGSNSIDVATEVKNKMKQLSKNFPDGVEYQVTLDTTDVINASIKEVIKTLFETTALVVLVILLFLQNFRAVIIPCISIPVSLIGTLAIMGLLGFSINTLTLFGLILAVAIVVDDAIIVVENSSRLLETGKYNTKDAVIKAMGEITGPIVSVVLVLLSVFIPTTLISGITGQLYKQFALTIAASTVISGFNSLTLTPALCGLFLLPPKPKKFFIYRWFNDFYNGVQKIYDTTVKWLLDRVAVALLTFAGFVVIAVLLFMKLPTTFIPEEDDGYFIIMTQLPPAASLERTEALGSEINKILNTYPEVKSYIQISGFSAMAGGEQTNGGTYFVVLKNWSERKGKAHTVFKVVDRFNVDASVLEAGEVFAMVPPAISGLGTTGGIQMQLEDTKSLGPTAMSEAVTTILEAAAKMDALENVQCQYQANVPQYYVNIDRDKVQFMGLQLNDVFDVLGYYMGATYVNDYVQYGHIFHVNIEAANRYQVNIEDVFKLAVPNGNGENVPFSAFCTLEEVLGQDQINRYNLYSTAAITASVPDGKSSSEAIQQLASIVDDDLEGMFGYEWTSIAYQETSSSSTTMMVFIVAIIVAYCVLCAQYESWTNPIAAILGIPVALLGGLLGCLIIGTPISIYTQIGFILLIALSAKNGILIVQFAQDYHKDGSPIKESAYEAGHVRLRPILMTSFAFVFGVMPLIFSTGAGANSRIALGTAVVFGMFMNTVLATFYVPNFYDMMQRLAERFRWKRDTAPDQASGSGDQV